MSNKYSFATPFMFGFYVEKGEGSYYDIASLLTPPDVYLFDEKPSRELAQTGTDALQTINAWVPTTNPIGAIITVGEILDPNPSSNVDTETYYLAINYRLADGGEVVTDIEEIEVSRAFGNSDPVKTDLSTLQELFHDVDRHASETEQLTSITVALAKTRLAVNSRGILDWDRLKNKGDLDLIISMLAMSNIYFNKSQESDDHWYQKFEKMQTDAYSLIKDIPLEVDTDNDGDTDIEEEIGNYITLVR